MIFSLVTSFIKGNASVYVENGFADRFVALCHMKKIPLKKVKCELSSVRFNVDSKYVKSINSIAAQSGMTVSVLSKKGLPELFNTLKIRFGLPIGMVLAFAVYCIVSSVVWSIEIKGCEQVDINTVVGCLTDSGVSRGAFIHNIDCKSLSQKLERIDERIYSTAVNIEGCKIFVGIVEKELPEKVIGTETYSNIIARYGGEITEVDVYSGESQVEVGDSVVKGDLLVNGVQNGKNGEIILADSKADIIARTSHMISCDSSGMHNINILSKSKDFFSAYFFGLYLLPRKPENCSVSENEYFADTKSTIFPIGFVRQRQTFFETVPFEFNENIGRLICLYDLATSTVNQIGERKVIEQRIKFVQTANIKLEAEYICEENICEKKYLEVLN